MRQVLQRLDNGLSERTRFASQDAAREFDAVDQLVMDLEIDLTDDGQAAIALMEARLEGIATNHSEDAVVASTVAGLKRAYRTAIVQRVLDLRFSASQRRKQ